MNINQSVYVRNPLNHEWEPGTIIREATSPRSYDVVMAETGKRYRRNRVHLKTAPVNKNTPQPYHRDTDESDRDNYITTKTVNAQETVNNHSGKSENANAEDSVKNDYQGTVNCGYTTRSGRVIKPPNRYE